MASALAVGKADGELLVDLAKEEDNFGESDTALSFAHRTKQLLLVQMDGLLTKDELHTLIDNAEKVSEEVHQKQVDALKRLYEKPTEPFKL